MLSRRYYEKKIREEQEATAHVFQDFITTFQENVAPPNKTFVKSGVLYPEAGKSSNKEISELYSPKPIVKVKDTVMKTAIECARLLSNNKLDRSKKQKPTSNLELLKEELKQRHTERDEKNKNKDDNVTENFFCDGDPNSTNLFVANLNTKITENDLMRIFGTYGPLASVKIMWPRGDERFRNTNCGFVAYMSRKDAERALNNLKHRNDMRVGWGKCVEIPNHPIYVPQSLLKLYLPPPYTGLPFNAQPLQQDFVTPTNETEMQHLLKHSVVKVTVPFDKKILMIVHRVIEFVIREGPLFEAYIMNKEIDNPDYNFLFENKNPVHTYYRWKLYSIQHGEGQKSWSTQPFRMFKDGSIWTPPIAPSYTDGMPDELFDIKTKNKTELSQGQLYRLMNLIRNLTVSKISIAEVMVFCLNKRDAMCDIVQMITDSLLTSSLDPLKKIARLYLLSDVLYNCQVQKITIDNFESLISNSLLTFFRNGKQMCDNFKCHYNKEAFKTRLLKVLRCWDIWRLFPIQFIRELESIILENDEHNEHDEGNSSNDEPLDGANLIKRSIKNSSIDCQVTKDYKSEKTVQLDAFKDVKWHTQLDGFKATKWHTVDPNQIEAQAMSTKKMYEMENKQKECKGTVDKSVYKRSKSGRFAGKNGKSKPYTNVTSKWDSDDEVKKQSRSSDKGLNKKQMKRIEYLVKKYREEIERSGEYRKASSVREQIEKYKKGLIKDMMEDGD